MIQVIEIGAEVLAAGRPAIVTAVMVRGGNEVRYEVGCWCRDDWKTEWFDAFFVKPVHAPRAAIGFAS
jgi:hypothetical protein